MCWGLPPVYVLGDLKVVFILPRWCRQFYHPASFRASLSYSLSIFLAAIYDAASSFLRDHAFFISSRCNVRLSSFYSDKSAAKFYLNAINIMLLMLSISKGG